MPRLLIIHHSVSPDTVGLFDAVVAGATDPAIVGVDVVSRLALETGSDDVLAADAILLGTTANFGYMSGALKHFFDTTYDACLPHTVGRPYALWVHGRSDTTGAVASVEKIVTGLGWTRMQDTLSCIGKPTDVELDRAWELGAASAALLMV